MSRSALVLMGLVGLSCAAEIQDPEGEVASREQGLTSWEGYYTAKENGCGVCAAASWSTQWIVRGGGADTTCSPTIPYLCHDDARFSNVWPRADGSSFALGSFNGSLNLGNDTHQSGISVHDYPVGWSVNNAVLAKVSQNGQVLWTRAFLGSDNTWTYGLAEDGAGNVYVTGTFADPLTIGTTTLKSNGSVDVFIAKLDSSGNPLWAVSGGSPDYDYSSDLVLVGSRVYIVGTTGAGAKYGALTLTSHGAADAFVAAVDVSTGAWVWGASAGGPGPDAGRAIAKASYGAVLLGGSFSGVANVFGQGVTSEGDSDGFVAKVSATGSLDWLRVVGGSGEASVEAIAYNSSSGVAIAGGSKGIMAFGGTTSSSVGEDDGFVAALGSTGAIHWSQTLGGSGSDRAKGVAIDSSANLFVTGSFSETALFGSSQLTSVGESDVFVAELHSGQWVDLVQAGGPGADSSRRIANLGNDRLWVTGRVLGGSTEFAGLATTVDGVADAFLWHLRKPSCRSTRY